jgi:hypothetical protein
MRNRADIKSGDIYKAYVKGLDNFERNAGFLISQKEINSAVFKVNELIIEDMIMNNRFLNIPYRLGTIGIFKYKPKLVRLPSGKLNLPVDYKKTNELCEKEPDTKNKKYIYHRNRQLGGHIATYKWLKHGARVRNILGYRFVPVKGAKRRLAAAIKDPTNRIDFFEHTLKNNNGRH